MNTEYDHLAHHGILGQKWGVRRYQNSDGTLTDLGKKRYRKDLDRFDKLVKKSDAAMEKANREKERAFKLRNVPLIYATSNRKAQNAVRTNYKISKKAMKQFNKLTKLYGDLSVDKLDKKTIQNGKMITERYNNIVVYDWGQIYYT